MFRKAAALFPCLRFYLGEFCRKCLHRKVCPDPIA